MRSAFREETRNVNWASRLSEYGFWYFFSLFNALFTIMRRGNLVLGQVQVEKLKDATAVFVAYHIQRLVMLGSLDNP